MYIEQWYNSWKVHVKELNSDMILDRYSEAEQFRTIVVGLRQYYQSKIDELQQKLNEEIAKNVGFVY